MSFQQQKRKNMRRFIILITVLVSLLALAGCSVMQEPEAASAPIEAVPLDTGASGETAVSGKIYQIAPEGSEVRFELDEDLRGNRITVVGSTDQVAGEIALDLSNLSGAQVGVIQINARTLATDNDFRNRALNNEILDTGAYEFITFTPTAVNGLPTSATIGDAIEFTIDGTLTIRDTTLPVTFNVTATAVSDSQLQGTASTIINRNDFGLTIPSVPSVANVEEEVELYINFTANAS
jgi:polyisoprenoid-binding protein YceI